MNPISRLLLKSLPVFDLFNLDFLSRSLLNLRGAQPAGYDS